MKERSLNYEDKFRKYLFSFDFETHKKICENLNVKPNIPKDINKKDENLRTKILSILKDSNESIDEDKLFDMLHLNHYTKEDFKKEIIGLFEDGFIFETRPKKLRYLG